MNEKFEVINSDGSWHNVNTEGIEDLKGLKKFFKGFKKLNCPFMEHDYFVARFPREKSDIIYRMKKVKK